MTKQPMATKKKSRSIWKTLALGFVLLVLCVVGLSMGALIRMMHKQLGEQTAGSDSWIEAIKNAGQVITNPRAGFPGKDRINILCMGIDDNWTDSDIMYTVKARTDTLFMLSLDMNTKKVTMLSIPRDSYVPIAGTNHSDKINSAYSSGGPKRAMATVANLTGVDPDYYVLLKIDATKALVDELGGVDVNVENPMDYDDNWGHLHVHLRPGLQHLNGDQAVGFARFRHGNHGVTPEDGDERRIYRQHVLLRAMVERMKLPANLSKPDSLVDTAMSQVETNLTRAQIFDIGAIFRSVKQEDIQTAQIPGSDAKLPNGAYIMELDPDAVTHYSDWLLRGDEAASYPLIPVLLKNGTNTSGLAAAASKTLTDAGFTQAKAAGNSKQRGVAQSVIIDTGVTNHQAAAETASLLGIPGATVIKQPVKPNHLGWTPLATLTVILGADYAAHAPLDNAQPHGA